MKKAQAAMEFLMTYGWAILVVLLSISALAYFGVLDPAKYLPSTCTLDPGLACVDFKVDGTDNEITLVIRNGMGEDLNPFNISIGGECNGSANIAGGGLIDGAKEIFVISCAKNLTGSKLKEDILINYASDSGITHKKTGSISAKIE